MGEVFENARVFVKNVADVFGKGDGHRFKCPRCKGSGLNTGHQFWNRSQSSSNIESCWFCEGVGVMPVIGFNGFTLGPSKSLLNTRAVNPLPELPLKMQLYLGKYPETKCTLTTYKPSMSLSGLLYDPNQFPSWMNGFSNSSEISGRGSISSKPVEIRKSSKTRVSISSRQPNSRISRDPPHRGLSFEESPSEQSRVTRRSTKVAPRRSGGSLLVTVRKTMCTSLSAPMRVASSTRPAEGGTSPKYPVLRTTKSKRAPRRERNRVREEAEKEAYLRAYKFQKPCAESQSEARNVAVSESPDSRQQLGGDKLEHLRNLSLGATGVVKSRNSLIMPSLKISSDSPTINQLALGKVKDGIVRSPSLGKAFQLH